MLTTTDQTDTRREDRPTGRTGRSLPARSVRSCRAPRCRRILLGSAVGTIALTAVSVAMLLDDDSTDTSAPVALATGVASPADPATELDIHGIPTWWSGEPAAPQRAPATELDIHGIPTWWSGEPAAARGLDRR